jgi:hypothetical protein
MKILRFDSAAGRSVSKFGSQGARILPAARLGERASVHWLTIGPQGILGYHWAASESPVVLLLAMLILLCLARPGSQHR